MTARKNPIQRRLDLVSDQWVEFAELPNARLLCWLCEADEFIMAETFVRAEAEDAGTLPDLFVRLTAPFSASQSYGYELYGQFVKHAEALHTGLEDPNAVPWTPPAWQRGERDVSMFVRTCVSFIQHFELPAHLALLLTPSEVADPNAFQIWVQQFISESPANLRAIVLDDVKTPAFAPLVRAEPVRVVSRPLDLNMPAAKLETSKEAGNLDSPGGKFRHLFVQLTNALGEGDLAQAHVFGQAALTIAAAQNWFALAVPIHFALGAALSAAGRTQEANERYVGAEVVATEGEKSGDPICTKLKAQARMARGGLLIHARAFNLAGQLFAETVPMATAAQDPRMVLDCYRLASFSYEQDGQHEKAWQYGVDGLGYARGLDKQTLETSTFAYLGEGLMRITQRAEYRSMNLRVEQEIVGLLGRRDWRPKADGRSGAQPHAAGAT